MRYAALLGSIERRLPGNPCSSVPVESALGWLATIFDMALQNGHQQHRLPLVAFASIE